MENQWTFQFEINLIYQSYKLYRFLNGEYSFAFISSTSLDPIFLFFYHGIPKFREQPVSFWKQKIDSFEMSFANN